MSGFTPRTVAFVGTGTTQQARVVPGSHEQLHLDAVMKAVANAGLKLSDIDGFVTTFSSDPYQITEMLGIDEKTFCFANQNGCGSTGVAADAARWALESGRCKYVVMVCGAKESAGASTSIPWARKSSSPTATGGGYQANASGGSIPWPNHHVYDQDPVWGGNHLNQYANVATRHMAEFGTTEAQIAAVSVAQRYNASLNPEAVYRRTISVDDVLNSRMISSPFTLLMCAAVNDGGAALVMTTAERARDLPNKPIYVIGSGTAHTGYVFTKSASADPNRQYDMVRTVGKIAAERAFSGAGVGRRDIDFIQSAEHFAISPILLLEDYGFVDKGEGGPFFEGGTRTTVHGELPFNTYGGEMSGTHAPGAHAALVESVRQLQGVRGEGQVKDAEIGLFISTCGKVTTHSALILAN